MTLYDEFYAVIGVLNRRRIPYAVVGGLAVALLAKPRFTDDIDILINSADIAKVAAALDSIGYMPSNKPFTFANTALTLHRFTNIENKEFIMLDVLACNDDQHQHMIKRALRKKIAGGFVRVIRKEDLIWMKSKRNSDIDLVDIKRLSYDKRRSGA